MAQARRTRKSTSAAGGIPGWFWLLLGLGVGLAIAVVFYLQGADRVMLHSIQQERSSPRDTRDVRNDPTTPIAPPERARFEYYDLLPRDSVEVPRANTSRSDSAAVEPRREPAAAEPRREAPPATPRPTTGARLQTGSFQSAEPAEQMRAQLLLLGLEARVQPITINGREWHRVYVGPLNDEAQIQRATERLRANNIEALRVSGP